MGLQLVYFFQQEIFNIDVLHAPLVRPRQDIVAHHDDFGIGIVNPIEGIDLLLPFLFIGHGKGRLDVVAFVCQIDHEIYFELRAYFLPCNGMVLLDYAHIDVESPCNEFVIKDIFHNMVFFLLTEVETGIAQTDVREIVFERRVDV